MRTSHSSQGTCTVHSSDQAMEQHTTSPSCNRLRYGDLGFCLSYCSVKPRCQFLDSTSIQEHALPIQVGHNPQELQALSWNRTCHGRCSTLARYTGAEEPQLFGKQSPTTTLPRGEAVQQYCVGHLHVLKHPLGLGVTAPTSHFLPVTFLPSRSPAVSSTRHRSTGILPGLFGRVRSALSPAQSDHQQTWLVKAPPTNPAPKEI